MAESEIKLIPENRVYAKPRLLTDAVMHFCPGCSHGTIHKLVAEVIDEMQVEHDAIGITPVGCAVLAYDYVDIDWVQAAHGRAAAVATAIKRLNPSKLVFTYQGDGDLAAIGTGETIHACNRGENITIIYVNNAIYGMTGGQMAPTTLLGMKTATTPYGRRVDLNGYPFKISNVLSLLDGTCYVTRQSVHTPAAVRKAKAAIKKAFQTQIDGAGYSLVEVVATCPTNWGMTPQDSFAWMRENMLPYYPLGVYKDVRADGFANAAEAAAARAADCPIANPAPTEGGAR